MRLTKLDNEIFEHFKNDFPEIDVSKVIDEDAMKSKQGKERWRKFMLAYDKKASWLHYTSMGSGPNVILYIAGNCRSKITISVL